MPNTVPPITTAKMVEEYYNEISTAIEALDDEFPWDTFAPHMTMYLTDSLDPTEVLTVLHEILGIKYYPRGLTTNSDSGVENPASLWTRGTRPYECLRLLAKSRPALLLHAADGVDASGRELDPYDQEPHFIRETLPRIIDAHPDIRISVEHLSTKEGAEFIARHGSSRLGCSLTAHHLLLDRRDVFRGGFHPHRDWRPVIQRREDKEALRKLASQGFPFVWLGSDSAPHPRSKKESDCCASGVLMAHAGIELYVEAFEDMDALDKLERFACINGPRFFATATVGQHITFVREEWAVQPFFAEGIEVVPFRLGEKIRWKLEPRLEGD